MGLQVNVFITIQERSRRRRNRAVLDQTGGLGGDAQQSRRSITLPKPGKRRRHAFGHVAERALRLSPALFLGADEARIRGYRIGEA